MQHKHHEEQQSKSLYCQPCSWSIQRVRELARWLHSEFFINSVSVKVRPKLRVPPGSVTIFIWFVFPPLPSQRVLSFYVCLFCLGETWAGRTIRLLSNAGHVEACNVRIRAPVFVWTTVFFILFLSCWCFRLCQHILFLLSVSILSFTPFILPASVCMTEQLRLLHPADEQWLQPAGEAAAVSIYQSRAP